MRADGYIEGNRAPRVSGAPSALTLAALGIVFGDIGTSPLYALKTVLGLAGGKPEPAIILGSLSLVVWTLVLVTSVKYIALAMRVDNDGEGGILALMSLLGVKHGKRPAIIAVGLLGAALIYGDGAITPAISVLSAMEGLDLAAPSMQRFVVPLSVLVLVALFAAQPLGTRRIGGAFGPIMLAWFAAIGALGIGGIVRHPAVLWALDPRYGLRFLLSGGAGGFLVLGGVFLCVTGAEALYADMGHFGPRPIRRAWFGLVFPTLLLNYAGQSALALENAAAADNTFFLLCPQLLMLPLVLLATVATVIASQSIITGAFSMTRQAIQLGWLPRLKITQTSAEGYGQIYVGAVNWLLMLVTLGLTIGFGKSDRLAAAYGIAVSATMLMTSVLLYIAMREIWRWDRLAAGAVAGVFIAVDAGFVAANSVKIADGGYVPLVLAGLVYGLMLIWHIGAGAVSARLQDTVVPVAVFMEQLARGKVPRVPGMAVFLTRTQRDAPPVLVWHLKHNRALHEKLFVFTVSTESVPWIEPAQRLGVTELAPCFWRGTARYGFMERPDIPALLQQAQAGGCAIDLADVTYYVGHETIVSREDDKALPRWLAFMFTLMQRNSEHVTDYFKLPRDSVVEIGREIAI
jgi:KUP system potassium uptake protein